MAPSYAGLSRINASGLPVQWLLKPGEPESAVRFVCECGVPGTSSLQRAEQTWAGLEAACDEIGCSTLSSLREAARWVLPSAQEWPRHWCSAIWSGAGINHQGAGLKVYFNMNRDSARMRWLRVGRFLLALGREQALATLCTLSPRVSEKAWLIGLSVDMLPGARLGRIKCYFRSEQVGRTWLANWYEALDYPVVVPMATQLLDGLPLLDQSHYPDRSFHVSLEFHPQHDRPSLKTDLDFTLWDRRPDAVIDAITRQLAYRPGEDQAPYDLALTALGLDSDTRVTSHQFRLLGLGVEPSGEHHLNLYIEPKLVAPPLNVLKQDRRLSSVKQTLPRALDFLSLTMMAGHWQDYALPVGPADRWVTAYVLYALLPQQQHPAFKSFAVRLDTAAQWLMDAQHADKGWGYNAATPPDADSTALAMLALADRCPSDLTLKRCRRNDGGYATYAAGTKPGGAWTSSHVDVTPLAALADHAEPAATLDYLTKTQRDDGLWHGYWWPTPLYASWAALTWLRAQGAVVPRQMRLVQSLSGYRPAGSFERALLVLCLSLLNMRREAAPHSAALVLEQQADGSWPASAVLRLTSPAVDCPTEQLAEGDFYLDTGRIFTTATVINALCSGQPQ